MKLYYDTDGNILILMSPHVGFKEWPCHPAEYKGQGPQGCLYRNALRIPWPGLGTAELMPQHYKLLFLFAL